MLVLCVGGLVCTLFMFYKRRKSLSESHLRHENEKGFAAGADSNLSKKAKGIEISFKYHILIMGKPNMIAGMCQRYLGLLIM